MDIDKVDKKEQWTTCKIIEELYCDLISTVGEDGLRKYEEQTKYLLHRIPVWKDQDLDYSRNSLFNINLKDISKEVKERIIDIDNKEIKKSTVNQAVSLLFENLGSKEKEYFNKNVRHLLKVRFV